MMKRTNYPIAIFSVAGLAIICWFAVSHSIQIFHQPKTWLSASGGSHPISPHDPTQISLRGPAREFITGSGAILRERAIFEIDAVVLASSRYRFDRMASIMPYDLALGWGRMSVPDIVRQYTISQSGRFYFWSTQDFPIPPTETVASSANMHIVPANDEVMALLGRIRRGDRIRISGRLVDVAMDGRPLMKTSLSRHDAGAGACEIVLAEKVEIVPLPGSYDLGEGIQIRQKPASELA